MYTIQQPENLSCSFELFEKIIVVKAKLNGIERNFLLDSGAPDLILNKKHIKQNKLLDKKGTFAGSTGTGNVGLTILKNFKWESLTIKNKKTYVIDFEHLEKILNITIHGLIGYKVFRDYTLFIDYKIKQLYLWTDIKKSGFTATKHLDFVMDKHMPVIEAKVGNLKMKFGLDTGAADNTFISKHQKNILPHLKLINTDTLYGGAKTTKEVEIYNIDNTTIGEYSFKNMKFNMRLGKYSKRDGLLGYQFLKKRQVAINYPDRKLQFIRKKPATK